MLPAWHAILGYKVAHLCNCSSDSRNFHLMFIVYYDPCIIFKIKKHSIFSSVLLLLSNYHSWIYVLPELWCAFLDHDHHHVTHASGRKSAQPSLAPLHGDDLQIFGSYIFGTVDHGTHR